MIRFITSKTRLENKTVLLRVDFNVNIKNGKIIDDYRVQRVLPTIKFLLKKAKKVIVVSHRGSFEKENDYTLSLAPIAEHLSRLIGRKVYFFSMDLAAVGQIIQGLPPGSLALLENIRWQEGERENSVHLAKKLAAFAEVFVNDAFGESHRKVASLVAITRYLPSFGGLLLQEEIKHLDILKEKAKRPFVVILGGAKLKTKLPLIRSFLKNADYILLGGGLANTFLKAKGVEIGKSVHDDSFLQNAKALLKNRKILIPVDWIIAKSLLSKEKELRASGLSNKEYILDIGPKTIQQYKDIIAKAQTIFWNGPMGFVENPVFRIGSEAVLNAILANKKADKVVGGGDTIELIFNYSRETRPRMVKRLLIAPKLFLSTGGGAMLSYLAGQKLPGIEALKKSKTEN